MAGAEPTPAAERTADGVRRMFDRVAPRYDLANTVFSLGQDRAWRQAAARAAGLADGQLWVSSDRGHTWEACRLEGDPLNSLHALGHGRDS